MTIHDYKATLKTLIGATDSETLLKQWKEQLEWDVENAGEAGLYDEERQAVQEGLTDYRNGEVLSLKAFTDRR